MAQTLKKFSETKPEYSPHERCAECKQPLSSGAVDENGHSTSHGWLCDDCFYDRLGEEIENHPIGTPQTHGR